MPYASLVLFLSYFLLYSNNLILLLVIERDSETLVVDMNDLKVCVKIYNQQVNL